MGNSTAFTNVVLPECCQATVPAPDVDHELRQQLTQTPKSVKYRRKKKAITSSGSPSCLPPLPTNDNLHDQFPVIPKIQLDEFPPPIQDLVFDDANGSYCYGYSSAYTTTTVHSHSPATARALSSSSLSHLTESPGPPSFDFEDGMEYQDDASLILQQIQSTKRAEEEQRVSHIISTKMDSDWFDRYAMDSLYVRNDLNTEWKLRRIIQMNAESVCIFNEEEHQFEWIDKRSSKIRPHPAHLDSNHGANSTMTKPAADPQVNPSDNPSNEAQTQLMVPLHGVQTSIHEIQLNDPPQLACEPSKCAYYYHAETGRDYMVCCTEWSSIAVTQQPGIYRYDLNYGYTEFLAPYPVASSGYFEVTMDEMNQHLHIYCYPRWLILVSLDTFTFDTCSK